MLYSFNGAGSGDELGMAVAGAGDLNGDGLADLVVGVPFADSVAKDAGSALVFSGADGSLLYTFNGSGPDDRFGSAVSRVGDVDGDGRDDLIVGAPLDDINGTNSGTVWVYSGGNGSILHVLSGSSAWAFFGASVSGAGDVDGDGIPDLVVGAPRDNNRGSATIFSGATGARLYTTRGDAQADLFGAAVSFAGDVNGDGFFDFVVGAPGDDAGGTDAGRARVYSGCGPIGVTYCSPANQNSSGMSAGIRICGSDSAAVSFVWCIASDMPTHQFGYFLTSQTQGFTPYVGSSQGNLCLGGKIGRFRAQTQNSGTAGRFSIAVDLKQIPMDPPVSVMAGETWNFQAWFRDANPTATSNFTDAVSVVFQ